MATNPKSEEWELETFVNALTRDLDKVQDVLAVKGANTPLTYMVKDLSLDLSVAQRFDGKRILFRPAAQGDSAASKLTLQLGSINDRQIRETTRRPPSPEDVSITEIEDLDEDTKTQLESIGVKSSRDLQKVRERNIDLRKASGNKIDYNQLATLINKARRRKRPPVVKSASVERKGNTLALALTGENLFVTRTKNFPLAAVGDRLVRVLAATDRQVVVEVDDRQLSGEDRLQLALDPYAILTLKVRR